MTPIVPRYFGESAVYMFHYIFIREHADLVLAPSSGFNLEHPLHSSKKHTGWINLRTRCLSHPLLPSTTSHTHRLVKELHLHVCVMLADDALLPFDKLL